MEREIDLNGRHLVDWLKTDLARDEGRHLTVRATREFLAEACPAAGTEIDAEDDVEVVTTVGLLEVAPADGHGHWVLRLRVEDELGSHLPDDGSVPDGPEELGLDEFERCFLADGADGTVTLETGEPKDGRGFDRILARILSDRHARR
jgi:hypothetical protein